MVGFCCCCIKKKTKKRNGSFTELSGNNSSAITSPGGREGRQSTMSSGKVQSIEVLSGNWKDLIEEVWKRDIRDVCVHTDIPRIGSKLTVVKIIDDKEFIVLEPEGSNHEGKVICERAIGGICEGVVGVEEKLRLLPILSEALTGFGDVSQPLKEFFRNKEININPKVLNVLKCCNQQALIPAYYPIKTSIAENIKDSRGTWRVKVTIEESGVVRIKHTKAQVSTDLTNSEPSFSFIWELEIITDSKVENISEMLLSISNLKFESSIPLSRQTKIRDRLSNFLKD
eukprot:c16374_g1_i1.p1 GENE.c16374_g1_i1~~c16374_g1_i1.p1  ORF type:complete len:285 (+),score=117.89 c16374_g1_i1:87-941(+)